MEPDFSDYVFLCVDYTGRYAAVFVQADDKDQAIRKLEDAGLEVVEDQTEEYDPEDWADDQSMAETGIITINQLLHNSNFVPFP